MVVKSAAMQCIDYAVTRAASQPDWGDVSADGKGAVRRFHAAIFQAALGDPDFNTVFVDQAGEAVSVPHLRPS